MSVVEARKKLTTAEQRLSETETELQRLETEVAQAWEDEKRFAKVSGEIARLKIGRDALAQQVAQAHAELDQAVEGERQAKIGDLRAQLANLRAEDEDDRRAMLIAKRAYIAQHYIRQDQERTLIEALAALGISEVQHIAGDKTKADAAFGGCPMLFFDDPTEWGRWQNERATWATPIMR